MPCRMVESDEIHCTVESFDQLNNNEDDTESNPYEVLEAIRLVQRYRDELESQSGSAFRLRHSELNRGALGALSSAFLLEKDDEASKWGDVLSWTVTDRAVWYMNALDSFDHDPLNEDEVRAISNIGDTFFELPAPDTEFEVGEIESDIYGPQIASLKDAGLLRRTVYRNGHPSSYVTTQRCAVVESMVLNLLRC